MYDHERESWCMTMTDRQAELERQSWCMTMRERELVYDND